MTDQNHPDFVLLTGAGFSKPFDIPLASEISIDLRHRFLNPINNDILKRIDHGDNFEKIYSDLQEEKSDNLDTFTKAIHDIFEKINDDCKQAGSRRERYKLSLQRFIEDYFNDNSDVNDLHFFTLNQDVLLENLIHLREGPWGGFDFIYPGICNICGQSPADYIYEQNSDETIIISKNEISKIEIDQQEKFLEKFNHQKKQRAIVFLNQYVHKIYYYKLHGSSNWIDHDTKLMIMGYDKPGQISRNNLISVYFSLFENSIRGKNLLVIGYSFNDQHVNSIISNAVKESGTKVYYISPEATPKNKKLSDMALSTYLFPYKFENLLDYDFKGSRMMPPEMKAVRTALHFRDVGQGTRL